MPFDAFVQSENKTLGQLGPFTSFRIYLATWTKDPEQAPMPGYYAALDYSGSREKAQRICGYFILYQAGPDEPLLIVRRQNVFMSDEAATQVDQERGQGAAETAWANASRQCPNYDPEQARQL